MNREGAEVTLSGRPPAISATPGFLALSVTLVLYSKISCLAKYVTSDKKKGVMVYYCLLLISQPTILTTCRAVISERGIAAKMKFLPAKCISWFLARNITEIRSLSSTETIST